MDGSERVVPESCRLSCPAGLEQHVWLKKLLLAGQRCTEQVCIANAELQQL